MLSTAITLALATTPMVALPPGPSARAQITLTRATSPADPLGAPHSGFAPPSLGVTGANATPQAHGWWRQRWRPFPRRRGGIRPVRAVHWGLWVAVPIAMVVAGGIVVTAR